MAESKNRNKTPAKAGGTAAKKPAAGSKGASAGKGGTVTTTAASKAPAKSQTKKKNTTVKSTAAAGKPAKRKGDEAQQTAKLKRRSNFSEQFMPYIFAGLALIFAVCLVLNAIGGAEKPEDHLMGYVGYYLCYALFGCFGWTAYLIPLIFVNLAIFWRRYCEENLVAVKVVLSVLLMVMISAVIHVGVCTSDPSLAKIYAPAYLFKTGAAFESGGVVGGVVGNLFYTGLRLPGTIVLAVVTLPLMVMMLVGVTPAFVFGKLWASFKAWREKTAEEREARREEEAAEAEAERKAATAESYREKRAKLDADRRRAEASAGSDVDTAEETEDTSKETSKETSKAGAEAPARSVGKSGRRVAMVDTETGEMLEVPEEITLPATETKPKETEEEEELAALPFSESASKSEPVSDDKVARSSADTDIDGVACPDEDEDDGFVSKEFTADVSRSRNDAARREEHLYADEEQGLYDGDTDSMDTDLEEEAEIDEETDSAELTAAETTPGMGGVHVVTYTEAAEPKPSENVTVTILRPETAAIGETGLSEEELVISTAHSKAELPAEPAREYIFPSVDMLTRGSSRYEANDAEIAENTRLLREVLESFHIRVKEISCSCGPTITRFEVKPDTGIRVRSIANLVDDIAMNLAKAGVRIEAPIPGKAAVGIEVPNAEPATVYFRNILETPEFRNHKSRIAACLGADVSGRPVILDINKMPHLLIAGATGMGKSVCINSIVMSILYKAKPNEVKLILIDPKKVEFAMYRELPHLLCPIVSDPKQAAGTLYCAVNEMERRFGLIEEVGVRNLAGYNEVTADDPERPPLPQIVIIIDELADLMMTAPADVETAICRLAQKARAAGIHLVIGTQRPSVDVITGLIKANIPSRIAFTVASAVDSRTIIDTVGADKLIGRGDMLYAPVGVNKPMRCQGTFVSETEVERVVTFIKENNEPVVYDEEFIKNIAVEAARCGVNKKKGEQVSIDDFDGLGGGQNLWGEEPKFWEALEVIVSKEKIGTSALQRALHLGYGKAASIIDRMEEYGFVGPDPGNKTGRDVRITHEQLLDYKANGLPGNRGGNE